MPDPSAILKVASGISSILGLVAFLSTLYFYFRREELSQQEKRLALAPLDGRTRLLDDWLTRYGLSADGLPEDKRYALIKDETERRFALLQSRQRGAFAIATMLVLCAVALVLFSMKLQSSPGGHGSVNGDAGKRELAYRELVRSFSDLLEPFSLLASKRKTVHYSGGIVNRELPQVETQAADDFGWLERTVAQVQQRSFIDELQRVPAVDRPDELLTPSGMTWAYYFAEQTSAFERKLDTLVGQYQYFYDAETLRYIGELKGHRFSRILKSLPGNVRMNIEQGNGDRIDAFTLYFGFFGPHEPEVHYLPYFGLVQKLLGNARAHAQPAAGREP